MLGARILQGSANPRTPGSEKMRIKSCVLLPAAGRKTQLFILIFSEPGVRGLAYPCRCIGEKRISGQIPSALFLKLLHKSYGRGRPSCSRQRQRSQIVRIACVSVGEAWSQGTKTVATLLLLLNIQTWLQICFL